MGPLPRNILADELIRWTGEQAARDCPHLLRRVVVWDEANKREIVLLTTGARVPSDCGEGAAQEAAFRA